jgi:enoyl-CoA hydratase/carnithine racemase
MESASWVRLEHDDGVAEVVLDRPPVNQFDAALVEAVLAAVPPLDEDERVRAVLVRSAVPRMFAAGGDLPWMARAPLEEQVAFVARCQQAYTAFEALAAPVVVAIEGPCLGGGLELSLCCDIRVAGAGATLGLPETTVGLIAGAGGTQRLVRAVGQGVARDLLLTGRRLSGAEAGAMGIVSRVVEDGGALEAARAVARQLADGATEAIMATKRLAVAASELAIDDGLARERAAWAEIRRSAATQEGLEAFAEKRRPDFRGARDAQR